MQFADKISAKPITGFRQKTIPVLQAIILITVQVTYAQIFEDFSDNNLNENPAWLGTTEHFIINGAGELQLNAPTAGTSWIATPLDINSSNAVEWEFLIRQSFSPSAANYARFYLTSDQIDLTGPVNGYFVQFGEAGSGDAIELFRQGGEAMFSVCRGRTAGIAGAFSARVKVRRQADGRWELLADYNGGTDFASEATGIDEAQVSSLFIGLRCTYTISNATRFFFDDVSVRITELPDRQAPKLLSIEATSAQTLTLKFSEALGLSSEDPASYFVSPSPGHPATATRGDDNQSVYLNFVSPFVNGQEAVLVIENVEDLAGNRMTRTERKFLYSAGEPAEYRDVVISEIFADPSPSRGLPAVEFIEIFNRSNKVIDLSGWRLGDATGSAEMTPMTILSGQYVILTSSNGAALYTSHGMAMGLTGFPSLNNSGDVITLRNDQGHTIDSLAYRLSWYRDDEKSEGGWSLELIDPQNICASYQNWTASESDIGGTPGIQNSVFANMPDNTGPALLSVVPSDSVTLVLAFSEKLQANLPSINNFTLAPALPIQSVAFLDLTKETLVLSLANPVDQGQTYVITVANIYDCSGNRLQNDFTRSEFVLPEHAVMGDIVINEILFNPRPTGLDFVEVYNASQKVIDMTNWTLRNSAGETGTITGRSSLLIRPGAFMVFTKDADILKGEYVFGKQETFIETDLPSLRDDQGSIALSDQSDVLIDSVFYLETMHSPFIKDPEGISLERVELAGGAYAQNWRSASSTVGFATPGYVNSNARTGAVFEESAVTVIPEIVQSTPARQGFAQIKYHFETGGLIGNIRIFDAHGRSIKAVANNELLAKEGFFRWDCDRDGGDPASRGYYVVWFEVFDAYGRVSRYKNRIAIF